MSLDENVMKTAVSARLALENAADEYVAREVLKMLNACNDYFVFLGKPEAKFTKGMIQSYKAASLSKQMELVIEGDFDPNDY